jgi:hypothetical protein
MTDAPLPDELASLRDLLGQLESGELKVMRGEEDVTKAQIAILRREIAFLNGVLVWLKAGGRVAPGLQSRSP